MLQWVHAAFTNKSTPTVGVTKDDYCIQGAVSHKSGSDDSPTLHLTARLLPKKHCERVIQENTLT